MVKSKLSILPTPLQILGYVKLLLFAQKGKKAEIQATLEDCFPDINVLIDEVSIYYNSCQVAVNYLHPG